MTDIPASSAHGPLLHRPIPSTEEELPVIGCGTWRGFDVPRTRQASLVEVLRELLAGGGRVIDSSPMYGAAERNVGEVLAELSPQQAFVATKVWTRGKDAGRRQMRESMEKLRKEPIDLMQVHNLVDWRTHLATLQDWKSEGRVRYIGVTHYTESAHAELETVIAHHRLDFVQLNYSAADRAAERRLLPLAAERGVAVLVNLPFGGGDLLSRLRAQPLPDCATSLGCRGWPQLLLKFVLAHPAVTCVIPGTGNASHMRANLGAGRGRLPEPSEKMQILAAISRSAC